MHRSRTLTSDEKWELGVILFFFFVSFLLLTVLLRTQAVPRLWAFAFHRTTQEPKAQVLELEAPTSAPGLLQQLTQVPALPEAATARPQVPMPTPIANQVNELLPKPPIKVAVKKAETNIRWFNGQKYRYLKTLTMRVTAYAPDSRCCWPYAGTTTASGQSVRTNNGHLVAADTRILPFHSLVSVPGYHGGELVPVLDRGGAIKGNRLDVLLPTFDQAKRWGAHTSNIKVYVPVEDD